MEVLGIFSFVEDENRKMHKKTIAVYQEEGR